MSAKKPKTVADHVAAVEAAQQALNEATEGLHGALVNAEVGETFKIDDIPHEVVEVKGKKTYKCSFTKRQIAMMRGERVPPKVTRKKRAETSE